MLFAFGCVMVGAGLGVLGVAVINAVLVAIPAEDPWND